MQVVYSSPTGANMVAKVDKIMFAVLLDNAGNPTIPAVNVISSIDLIDGLTSITTAYTIANDGPGGKFKLSVTQNNETTDQSVAANWQGSILNANRAAATITDTPRMYEPL